MNSYVIMLVEASVAMVLFYTVYYLWLRKETFFQLNRIYLIWAVGISLIIPLINIPLSKNTDTIVVYNLLETISISALSYEQSFISKLSTIQWISTAYLLGVMVLSLRFLFRLWQLNRMAKKGVSDFKSNENKNIRFVSAEVVPFSFLNRIYINPNLYTDEQLNKIIAHETVHINQLHTVDSIMYELLIILFWFNPIAYRYRNSAKELHEYLADQGVVKSGVSSVSYQKLLFNQATGVGEIKLANSFNYSLIKRRLVMLTKIKSSRIAKIRLLFVVPVLLSVLLVFACNEQDTEVIDSNKTAEVGDVAVYDKVDEMPIYPGGDEELRMFIAENIKYPEEAKNEGSEGRVFVQFVVDENGDIADVKIKRGVNKYLDEEAIRVVSAQPKWKPGKQDGKAVKVQYTIPIAFKMSSEKGKKEYTFVEVEDENGNLVQEKLYFTVEEMPQYPGGDLALRKYIAMNVVYPEKAKELGATGRVFIQFTVDKEGKVVDVKHLVTKSEGKDIETIEEVTVMGYGEKQQANIEAIKALQEEAVRVVGSMGTWMPGKDKGEAVKVQFTVPINFQLN